MSKECHQLRIRSTREGDFLNKTTREVVVCVRRPLGLAGKKGWIVSGGSWAEKTGAKLQIKEESSLAGA